MRDVQAINSKLPAMQVVAEELAPSTKVDYAKPSSIGSVSDIAFTRPKRGIPNSFSVTLNNSAGMATKNYLIGDPDGLVADLQGGTLAAADSGTITPATMNKILRYALSIGSINYETTVGTPQFSQNIKFLSADLDGNLLPVSLGAQVAAARRNTQQNAKLLTLELNGMVLDGFSALLVPVVAGETVVLTFTPNGAAGRG